MEAKQVNQELKIVHKGFFWAVWSIIKFPFLILWKICKFVFNLLKKYYLWHMESREIEKRKKEINKFFILNTKNEERL